MRKFIFNIYLLIKGIFSSTLDKTVIIHEENNPISIQQQQKKTLAYYFNVNREDKIEYTNTAEDFDCNYSYLDDVKDYRFNRISEQVGLIYEVDQKTPKNAAEVFDMTYEQYEDYKKNIIPLAKERKILEHEIKEFLEGDKLDRIKNRIREQKKLLAQRQVANAVKKLENGTRR